MDQKLKHQLICFNTDEILFEGRFTSLKHCVEAAVADYICLDGVDLTKANLANANLDDAQMAGAMLRGANLNGANLSEGVFDHADMRGADLAYACLALSSCMNVDMTGASFAATDVTDAVISGCQFSCPSVFQTPFRRAAIFGNCCYIHEEKGVFSMRKPPVVINGLNRDIVYLDHIIKVGNDFIPKQDLLAAGDRHLEFLYGSEIAAFLRPALYDGAVNLSS